MSKSDSKDSFEKVRKNLTLPVKRDNHLDVWAEETFDRLSKHTSHQKERQQNLEADLGELMDRFDDLTDSYVH